MKRKLLVLLVVVLTLGLTACSKKQQVEGEFDGSSQAYFMGEVLEVREKLLLVEVNDKGNVGLSKGDQAYVSLDVENAPVLMVGDIVKIVFNGEIMETYPVKLGEVFAIYKMNVDVPKDEEEKEDESIVLKYTNSLGVVENGVIYSEAEISEVHKETIADIIAKAKWVDGTSDCLNDVMIKLDEEIIYYHFDCGTLNDTVNNRSFTLPEVDQRVLSEIMFRYIGFK